MLKLVSLPNDQDLSDINGPRKVARIFTKPGMSDIHKWLMKHVPDEMIYQLSVADDGYRGVFGFYEFLGGMFAWPHNTKVGFDGVEQIVKSLGPVADFIAELSHIDDKYPDFSASTDIKVDRVLLPPGTELLRYLTDRHDLTRIANEVPNTYIKPHPITTASDIRLLSQIGKVLPVELSAAQFLTAPDIEICSSSCSTLAFQAKLNGKSVISLDYQSPKRKYRARYEKFGPYIYGDADPSILGAILSSPLSGYFHPGVATERDVKDFIDFYMDIQT